jgi:branched-chain amino acid transport system substrate-binding protein
MTKKIVAVLLLSVMFCFLSLLMGSCDVHAEKEVRFGILTALSGPASVWGIANSRAMSLNAEMVNDKGGFKVKGETYKWKVLIYDQKYIPAEAVKALNKAIYSDKVSFVSVMGGSPLLACIPLLKQNNILSLSDAAGGKAVTNPENPLVFRHNPGIEASYAVGLKYMQEKLGVKTIASMNPDDETGRSGVSAVKYVADKIKLAIIASENYERGTKDFSPVLTKIIAKHPDLIETGYSDPTSQALILKQARELGYKGKMYLIWGPDQAQVLKIAGSLAEGAYLGVAWPEPRTPLAKELYARFVKQYPKEWNANYYTHSALFTCLSKAIEKAQSFDPVAVAKALEELKWEGALGTYSWGGKSLFGIKRQLLMPVTLLNIEKGKVNLVITTPVPPGVLD